MTTKMMELTRNEAKMVARQGRKVWMSAPGSRVSIWTKGTFLGQEKTAKRFLGMPIGKGVLAYRAEVPAGS